jgi:hypothetical protein
MVAVRWHYVPSPSPLLPPQRKGVGASGWAAAPLCHRCLCWRCDRPGRRQDGQGATTRPMCCASPRKVGGSWHMPGFSPPAAMRADGHPAATRSRSWGAQGVTHHDDAGIPIGWPLHGSRRSFAAGSERPIPNLGTTRRRRRVAGSARRGRARAWTRRPNRPGGQTPSPRRESRQLRRIDARASTFTPGRSG